MAESAPTGYEPVKQESSQASNASAEPTAAEMKDLRTHLLSKAGITGQRKLMCLTAPQRAAIMLEPYAEIKVEVVEARNLFTRPVGFIERQLGDIPDAFVQLYLDDVPLMDKNENYIKTVKQMDDYHPKWNETFEVPVVVPYSVLRLHVYDWDLTSKADPMGFVEINVAELPWDETIDGWFELCFPEALQGTNTDRTEAHKNRRYEDQVVEQEKVILEAAKLLAAAEKSMKEHEKNSTEPLLKAGDGVEAAKERMQKGANARIARMYKAFQKSTTDVLNAGANVARSASQIIRGEQKEEPPHRNSGEIHVRLTLKAKPDVNFSDRAFALTMNAECQDYANFVQDTDLPQLDLQELVDDAMDIKLLVFDDLILSFGVYCWYIIRWRSKLLSLLVMAMFGTGFFINTFELTDYSALGPIVWHVGLLILLLFNASDTLRKEMTTNATNAPCDQEGFLAVVKWDTTSQVYTFLSRCIAARDGIIHNDAELHQFAGMCFVNGTPVDFKGKPVTLDQLMYVLSLNTLDFVSFPKGVQTSAPPANSLVYIDDRHRGTVLEVLQEKKDGNTQVCVEMDEDALVAKQGPHEEIVEAWRVVPRIDVPSIPTMLVPEALRTQLRLAGMQVDILKKQLIPIAHKVSGIFTWREKKLTFLFMLYLVLRVLFATAELTGVMGVQKLESGVILIRRIVVCIIFLAVAMCQAAPFQMLMNFIVMVVRLIGLKRTGPQGWAFYRGASVAASGEP